MKKVKQEYIGKYITVYINGRAVSFNIADKMVNDSDFWVSKGIGHIFEEVTVKKFKTEEDGPA